MNNLPVNGEKKLSHCKVMVVDDNETNIDILVEALVDDYRVIVAMDGKTALEDIPKNLPDLILLDIMMPEMDGYEVCKRLKADEKTKEIPVIFITAKGKVEDEIKGLDLGAIDYLIKPISPPLVKARVKNHLKLKLAQDELQKQKEILEENARLREDVERISRHDLKSPLTSIISLPKEIKRKGGLDEKQLKYIDIIEESGYRILNMVNRSLDLYKMENKQYQFKPTLVNLLSIIKKIIEGRQSSIAYRKISANILVHGDPPKEGDIFEITGEELLCYTMLENIIKNAIEACPNGGQVTIFLDHSNKFANIRVFNKGTVSEDIRHRFFKKYSTSGKDKGTGLGTYSAKLMAETQGGRIHMETSEKKGTTVSIELPK